MIQQFTSLFARYQPLAEPLLEDDRLHTQEAKQERKKEEPEEYEHELTPFLNVFLTTSMGAFTVATSLVTIGLFVTLYKVGLPDIVSGTCLGFAILLSILASISGGFGTVAGLHDMLRGKKNITGSILLSVIHLVTFAFVETLCIGFVIAYCALAGDYAYIVGGIVAPCMFGVLTTMLLLCGVRLHILLERENHVKLVDQKKEPSIANAISDKTVFHVDSSMSVVQLSTMGLFTGIHSLGFAASVAGLAVELYFFGSKRVGAIIALGLGIGLSIFSLLVSCVGTAQAAALPTMHTNQFFGIRKKFAVVSVCLLSSLFAMEALYAVVALPFIVPKDLVTLAILSMIGAGFVASIPNIVSLSVKLYALNNSESAVKVHQVLSEPDASDDEEEEEEATAEQIKQEIAPKKAQELKERPAASSAW